MLLLELRCRHPDLLLSVEDLQQARVDGPRTVHRPPIQQRLRLRLPDPSPLRGNHIHIHRHAHQALRHPRIPRPLSVLGLLMPEVSVVCNLQAHICELPHGPLQDLGHVLPVAIRLLQLCSREPDLRLRGDLLPSVIEHLLGVGVVLKASKGEPQVHRHGATALLHGPGQQHPRALRRLKLHRGLPKPLRVRNQLQGPPQNPPPVLILGLQVRRTHPQGHTGGQVLHSLGHNLLGSVGGMHRGGL
mmetsp:Transcript_3286/g.6577  ORF Transcript_3286/g.6577 Transcript_3286/m.6577 type:complete len:245 (-) Transcript_3286:1118-1852(-)